MTNLPGIGADAVEAQQGRERDQAGVGNCAVVVIHGAKSRSEA
jgi:hypothetical protein